MKKYIQLISLFIATFAFTIDANAAWNKKEGRSKSQESSVGKGPGHGRTPIEMTPGYSAPGRWNSSWCWDFFASGSFLYWHVSEDGLFLGRFNNSNTPIDADILDQKFRYKPGFKINLGTNLGKDDWMGLLEYTRLHMSTERFKEVPPGGNSFLENSTWWNPPIPDETNVQTLRGRWKCNLDVLDGEISRAYYLGHMLIFRPFMGPRVAWLKQRMTAGLTQLLPTDQDVFNARWRSKGWALGPRAGLDMNWELEKGFRITGSFAGSLLFNRHRIRTSIPQLADPDVEVFFFSEVSKFFKPNAEMGMGLGWGSYFANQTGHFDIHAAYEFHYWWNQNMMRTFADRMTDLICAKPSDLMYHGLTLTLRLDF